MALCIATPGGRASLAIIATAVITSALGVLFVLSQESPSSPEHTAISDSIVVLCFAIPKDRASPASLATAVSSALVESFSPGRADLPSPEDTASSEAVEVQCTVIS